MVTNEQVRVVRGLDLGGLDSRNLFYFLSHKIIKVFQYDFFIVKQPQIASFFLYKDFFAIEKGNYYSFGRKTRANIDRYDTRLQKKRKKEGVENYGT